MEYTCPFLDWGRGDRTRILQQRLSGTALSRGGLRLFNGLKRAVPCFRMLPGRLLRRAVLGGVRPTGGDSGLVLGTAVRGVEMRPADGSAAGLVLAQRECGAMVWCAGGVGRWPRRPMLVCQYRGKVQGKCTCGA
jgi:hypothetical protein